MVSLSLMALTLVILLLLSGFFSSSETGLMAINKYRLRHLANSGHRGARLAQKLLRRPDRLIGLILLGNNLVNIFAASLVTVIAIRVGGQGAIAAGREKLGISDPATSIAEKQMLAAVACAHQRRILHGDIKPENLILAREPNRLVMIDFGTAWTTERTTRRDQGGGPLPCDAPGRGAAAVESAGRPALA